MRVAIILVGGLLGIFGLWFALLREAPADAADVANLLQTKALGLDTARVELVGCQLSVRSETIGAQSAAMRRVAIDADLSLFEFQTVQVADTKDDAAILTIARKSASEALIAQGIQMAGAFPRDAQTNQNIAPAGEGNGPRITPLPRTEDGSMSEEHIRAILEKPGAGLTFQLSSQLPQGALETGTPIQPHKDAPLFSVFVDTLLAQTGPRTFVVTEVFQGVDPAPDRLIAATVSLPVQLQFVLPTREDARRMGEILFGYTTKTCGPA